MNETPDDKDFVSTAERHHQIMSDGVKFVRSIFIGAIVIVVFVCLVIFYTLAS